MSRITHAQTTNALAPTEEPSVYHRYGYSCGDSVTGVTGVGAVFDFAAPQQTVTYTMVLTVLGILI